MAQLDMSDAILAIEFQEAFTVTRRTEVVDDHGRVVPQSPPPTPQQASGTICTASPNDLNRLDDNQRMGRNLSIVTKFRLQGPSPGVLPDTVTWRGDDYVVKHIDPYQHYGAGFIQAIVGSVDSVDAPNT